MNFIQGRCVAKPQDLHLISELLEVLNSCTRKAFSKSLRLRLDPKGLTEVWAFKNGVYIQPGPIPTTELHLTSSQKSMIARHAKNLRTTANARAKYLASHYVELAKACEKTLDQKKKQIAVLMSQCFASKANLLKPSALKKKLSHREN